MMGKNAKIKIHKMDDWFSGVYIKPFGSEKHSAPGYEISQPHRHDFYYCVLLDKGRMELEVDFEKVTLADHCLFLSYPGQVHQINAARMERGWFLAFNPSMIDDQLKSILDQCLSQIILVPLTPAQCAGFCTYIDHLFTMYNDTAQLFRQAITQSMVTAFIYQAASAYLSAEQLTLTRHPARSIEITKTFKQLLRRNYKSVKRPSVYADKMNITTSYLNDTVRAVTGFAVTYFIQQELMREARRLLYYSNLSVKEVADALGYDDAKYFSRLFSKVIGMAPGAYRKKGDTTAHV